MDARQSEDTNDEDDYVDVLEIEPEEEVFPPSVNFNNNFIDDRINGGKCTVISAKKHTKEIITEEGNNKDDLSNFNNAIIINEHRRTNGKYTDRTGQQHIGIIYVNKEVYDDSAKEDNLQKNGFTERTNDADGKYIVGDSTEIIEVKDAVDMDDVEEEIYGFDECDIEDSRYTKDSIVKIAVGRGINEAKLLDADASMDTFKGFRLCDIRSSNLRYTIIEEAAADEASSSGVQSSNKSTVNNKRPWSAWSSYSQLNNPYAKRYAAAKLCTKSNKRSSTTTTTSKRPSAESLSGSSNNSSSSTEQPGMVLLNDRSVSSPLEWWQCFFTDSMLKRVVDNVNASIRRGRKPHHVLPEDGHETSTIELKAFLGVLYMVSWLEQCGFPIVSAFSKQGTGIDFIQSTMSYKRFKYICNHLTFDSSTTSSSSSKRRSSDPLFSLRWLLTEFSERCQNFYRLSENVIIRERTRPFRGKCEFVKYRHKIGGVKVKTDMKLLVLADTVQGYVYNLVVCTERDRHDTGSSLAAINKDVLELVEPIVDTDRIVFMDEKITTLPVCVDLLNECSLRSVGYIRKTRLLNVQQRTLTDVSNGLLYNSKFVSLNDKRLTFVAYMPVKGQTLCALSTAHPGKQIDRSSGILKRPIIIRDYQRTLTGVEALEKRLAMIKLTNASNWQCGVLFSLLEIAAFNSYAMFNRRSALPVAVFMKNLACSLASDFMRNKLQSKHDYFLDAESKFRLIRLTRTTDTTTASTTMNGLESNSMMDLANNNDDGFVFRHRCRDCGREKDRKTRYRCFTCEKHICSDHALVVCKSCCCSMLDSCRDNGDDLINVNKPTDVDDNTSNGFQDDELFASVETLTAQPEAQINEDEDYDVEQ